MERVPQLSPLARIALLSTGLPGTFASRAIVRSATYAFKTKSTSRGIPQGAP